MVVPRNPSLVLLLVALGGAALLLLQGCGGGGGSPTVCTAAQKAEHCSECFNHQCAGCATDYILDHSIKRCRAACITKPPDVTRPASPPTVVSHNGIVWPQMCINRMDGHFFGIGDWGGYIGDDNQLKPWVDLKGRAFVDGVDDQAQQLVAKQMNIVSATSKPDYVLNAGDDFYPGGIEVECGSEPANASCSSEYFANIFEAIYNGTDLKGKPWLGVLGNHDYGGEHFDSGWDKLIYRTWCDNITSNRWVTPAQFWSQRVQYADFAVDYFMLDSNYQDAGGVPHDICRPSAGCLAPTCSVPGLANEKECPGYFQKLWTDSLAMLEQGMNKSTAEWQIVITHFPGPSIANEPRFAKISKQYGVDLLFTGHQHNQQHGISAGTPFIISGGGGGITADGAPTLDGNNDAYGFVDFHINRTHLTYSMHSHGGKDGKPIIRNSTTLTPRNRSEDQPPSGNESAKIVV